MNNHLKEAVSSAPAKVILFGEHFVVYRNPAIAAAINKRIKVHAQVNENMHINIKSREYSLNVRATSNVDPVLTPDSSLSFLYPIFKCVKHVLSEQHNHNIGINLVVDSQVPYGEGLGSSAASCVATVAALYSLFSYRDRGRIYGTAKTMEENIHMNSSGIDCYVSTFGGIVNYETDKGFNNIRIKKNFTLLIGTTGVKHATGQVVSQVSQFREKNLTLFKDLSSRARMICRRALDSILKGNEVELGKLLTENQKLLTLLGVSHPVIEKLIERCLDNGALGAKLTGAGRGGAIIALIPSESCKEISDRIRKGSEKWMQVEFDHNGVAFG